MARKILVVDDHQDTREMLEYLFVRSDFEVSVAVDGLDGVERAREVRPDVILTDMHMPDLNGVEMIERMRQIPELRDTPIILLSADRSVERMAINAGANRFVKKPMTFAILVSVVEQLLSTGHHKFV